MSALYVGTSGWNHQEWKGTFYPDDVAQRRFLDYYATQFDATELNASFYRLPTAKMVHGWRERTPATFRFCPKMSRYLTHQKKLNDPLEPLQTFMERFEPLRDRLGPVLVQLPQNVPFDHAKAEAFLDATSTFEGCQFAVEARDDSWFADEALALLETHGVALVIAHSGGQFPYAEHVTAPFVYLRFHGPDDLYASAYDEAALAEYADKISHWLDEGRDVWAFFNNTADDFAPQNAERLRALVQAAPT